MKLSLEGGSLVLSDCFEKAVRDTVVGFLDGERRGHPKDYTIPVCLDAIRFFQKTPGCEVDSSVNLFLEHVDGKITLAKEKVEVPDYAFKDPQPFFWQRITFAFGTVLDQFLALLATGLGKTRTAIDLMCYRFLRNEVRRAIVVAPLSIHKQWEREIVRWHTLKKVDIRLVRGSKARRIKILKADEDPEALTIYLVNYEALRILRDELVKKKFDMSVADESTEVKNHRAKQSRYLKKVTRETRYRVALTGTPIWNRPQDVYSQYEYIDPFWFGTSYTVFKATFLIFGEGFEAKSVVGYKNLEEMSRRIYSIGIRFKKEDCLKDLPPVNEHIRRVEMTPEQKKIYTEAEKEFIVFIENAEKQALPKSVVIQNALVRILRLQQVCCGHVTDENKDTLKIPTMKPSEVEKILDEEMGEPGKKVIIWCRFVQDIVDIFDALSPKYACAKFYGGLSQSAKDAVLEGFQGRTSPDGKYEPGPTEILIAQISTGGVGIDLWMADTAIFYSIEWSLGVHEQAKGRNFRKGSEVHQSVTYYYVVVEKSIEERMLEELGNKRELADIVVNASHLRTVLFSQPGKDLKEPA